MREIKLNINESSKLVIKEVNIFWQKARIPIKTEQHCATKLQKILLPMNGEIYKN